MTKELNQQATEVGADEKFPDFPPRDEMENYFHICRPGHSAALECHFDMSNATAVLETWPETLILLKQSFS